MQPMGSNAGNVAPQVQAVPTHSAHSQHSAGGSGAGSRGPHSHSHSHGKFSEPYNGNKYSQQQVRETLAV